MPIGIGAGTLIAGIATGTAATAGAIVNSKAAKHAGEVSANSADTALKYQESQDAINRAQYLEERSRAWAQQDQDRALMLGEYNARNARLVPYRQLGADSAASLASLMQPNANTPDFHVPVVPPDTSAAALARPRPVLA